MREYVISILISILFSALNYIVVKIIKNIRKNSNKNDEQDRHPNSLFSKIMFLLMVILNVLTAILLLYFYDNNSWLFIVKRFLVLSVLWVSAYYDLKYFIIPNQIILFGICSRIVMWGFEFIFERNGLGYEVLEQIITAMVLVAVGILFSIISKNGLGMGDIKLFSIYGLFFGTIGSITSMFLSLLCSFFASIYFVVFKKANRKSLIPFGPCALLGTNIAIIIFGV